MSQVIAWVQLAALVATFLTTVYGLIRTMRADHKIDMQSHDIRRLEVNTNSIQTALNAATLAQGLAEGQTIGRDAEIARQDAAAKT